MTEDEKAAWIENYTGDSCVDCEYNNPDIGGFECKVFDKQDLNECPALEDYLDV